MAFADQLVPLGDPNAPHHFDWADDLSAERRAILEKAAPVLGPLFALSPYQKDLARRHHDWLLDVLAGDADAAFAELIAQTNALEVATEADIMRELRIAKARVALLIAVAECGGVWSPKRSTEVISAFADAALQAGLRHLIAEAVRKGRFAEGVTATNADCGLAIFALGKHGALELNYSSDIDIVAFFEADAGRLSDPLEATKFYSRLVRDLVRIMEDRTEHGYVFRTDLRLRPDPGSTPVAFPIEAALSYYEARGQNWERAAWIKARVCAGDITVGEGFLEELRPFVWRRHLDFATIADIQAMKRQINIARKVGDARVLGHNVKLGRGGIREIEFFAQTQQLIAGGRDLDLRVRPTVEALAALCSTGWITERARNDLTEAYWFLRAVENRIQMQRDEQTHSLPDTEEGLNEIAALMGLSPAEFSRRYRETLDCVMTYYAELFTEGESLASEVGDLVFTGSDDDPGTLETLSRLGFANPQKASATIRKWHYGSYAATRASAARAHLTEMLPALLTALAGAGTPDDALARFDNFLSRFPAGVQLFSLLRTNPNLARMLVSFMASAPRLAEAVIHRAHVMDGLIDPGFAEAVSEPSLLIEKVGEYLDQADGFEERIDRARIIGQEQKFLISAGFVSGTVDAYTAGRQFTTLAEVLLERLFASVRAEFARRHGKVPGAEVALIGFGKMASGEMTATSDLDFIMVYDGASVSAESDGEKPLAAAQYFARLTQRLVAALSAPTAEGVLYEADMRLRPSGNAGPLASSLAGFADYQSNHAWTWEHLALSRARPVAGDAALQDRIVATIGEVMSQPRDPVSTIEDVVAMRERLVRDRKPRHEFDLKLATGGLVDIEFVAQSAQLVAGARLQVPQAATARVLEAMAATGILPEAARLREIHATYCTVLHAMSTCLINPFSDESWTQGFKELLVELTHEPDFGRIEQNLSGMKQEVGQITAKWYDLAARL